MNSSIDMKSGDRFEISSSDWNIHDNAIAGCLKPVVLNSPGSDTSILKDNMISRDGVTGAKQAIQILRGQFKLVGNRSSGFDEPEP